MKKILETLRLKWAEYLLEMIVIIFGILGAFTLNSWNEERKNRGLEKTYLRDINKEFKDNRSQFELIMEVFLADKHNLDSAITLLPITKDNWPKIRQHFWRSTTSIVFNPSQSSIASLVSSSNLSIIQNRQLKDYLISWEEFLEDYKEDEYNASNMRDLMIDFYHNEPSFAWGEFFLSENAAMKCYKLIYSRKFSIERVLAGGGDMGGAIRVRQAMDSIISLTESEIEE